MAWYAFGHKVADFAPSVKKAGWKLYGYTPEEMDGMTDYFRFAYWEGLATKNGFVLCVNITSLSRSSYQVKSYKNDHIKSSKKAAKLMALMNDAAAPEGEKAAAKNMLNKLQEKINEQTIVETYPTYKNVNPKGCSWHIEKDGVIIDKGKLSDDYRKNIERFEKAINSTQKLVKKTVKTTKTSKKVSVNKNMLPKAILSEDIDKLNIRINMELTYGVRKGFVYQLTQITEHNFIFNHYNKAMTRVLKGQANRSNEIWLSKDQLQKFFEKGVFDFVTIETVTETIEKTVYEKATRQDKKPEKTASNVKALYGSVESKIERSTNNTKEDLKSNTDESEASQSVSDVTMNLNKEQNGIELTFASKPNEEIREALKIHGFRWSRYQKIWYAKQNADRLNFATALCGDKPDPNDPNHETKQPKQESSMDLSTEKQEATQTIDQMEVVNLSPDLCKRANESNFFSDQDYNHDYMKTVQYQKQEAMKLIPECNNVQQIHKCIKTIEYFMKNYHVAYAKYLSQHANNPSWMVTGRSGRNARKDQKMNERMFNSLDALNTLRNDYKSRLDQIRTNINSVEKKRLEEAIDANKTILDFTTKTIKGKRIYEHGRYFISKSWGCWRAYLNGQEIYASKTNETLKQTKKTLSYLILHEKNKNKETAEPS